MNTDEILRALHNTKDFVGVFPADQLPLRPRGIMICNLDSADLPGSHWLCLSFINEDGHARRPRGEVFDSLGQYPNAVIAAYMNDNCQTWTYNIRQLQSVISSFCGHYCIFYVKLRSIGHSMHDIVSSFTNDTAFNDSFVHAFVCLNNML